METDLEDAAFSERDLEDVAFSEHHEGHPFQTRTTAHRVYKPLMSFVFGKKKKRGLKNGNVVVVSDMKWSGRYDRLYDGRNRSKSLRKRPRTVRLRSSNRKFSWRFRIFRLRFKWISPLLLLKRLRDAYVEMMIKLANSNAVQAISKAYIA